MSTATAPLPLDVILRRSARAETAAGPDFASPVDPTRWFVCPTLTPLYYAPIYRDLSEEQQRRYNQWTGLCFNELIAFFEESFAASVLIALADTGGRHVDKQFAACLEGFVRDERQHIAWWRHLNRLTEPRWYANGDRVLIRFSSVVQRMLRFLTRRPDWFPGLFWIMLALEERSLDISRRTLQMPAERAEPHYRAVYQRHMQDEVRHVQLDWHLIDRFFATSSMRSRRWNARLLALMIGRFFLPPTRSAVRVVRRLVAEHSELRPAFAEMVRQLRQVGDDPEYHRMMYSRSTTPLTFALFDHFEEMHRMARVLKSYEPCAESAE